MIPRSVLDDPKLTAIDLRTFADLTDTSRDGRGVISASRLGERRGRKRHSAMRSVRRLAERGHIALDHRNGQCYVYRLTCSKSATGLAADKAPTCSKSATGPDEEGALPVAKVRPVGAKPVAKVRHILDNVSLEERSNVREGRENDDDGRAKGAANGHRPLDANELTAALLTLGISRSVAAKLVAENADRARDWSLFTLDRLPEDTRNPAAWITASIQRDEWPPAPPKPQPKPKRFFYDPDTREEIRY
jgi:hypothetical protein